MTFGFDGILAPSIIFPLLVPCNINCIFWGLYLIRTSVSIGWLWHWIASLQLICPPFSEHSINKVVGFHLVSSTSKVISRMPSLCSCSFIGTEYLWIALLTNQGKTPSFLGIISVENKLKHGTSIWHCASPGEPRKLKQKQKGQAIKQIMLQVRQVSKKESNLSLHLMEMFFNYMLLIFSH